MDIQSTRLNPLFLKIFEALGKRGRSKATFAALFALALGALYFLSAQQLKAVTLMRQSWIKLRLYAAAQVRAYLR